MEMAISLVYPNLSTMKVRVAILALLGGLSMQGLAAQETLPELTSKDSIVSKAWIAGLGINIIDDSGDAFNDFTTVKDQWNMVPYPSRLSIGRYFRSGLGVELIGSLNRYKAGNIIDGVIIPEDIPYWAIDSRLSYDLNKLVGETGFFDPYLGVGLGITDANNETRGTYNAVIGFRLWFSDKWGVDLNSSGKWRMTTPASNHIQHAAGVVYRFGIEKELSRKGLEKAALRDEMLAAEQHRQDSLRQAAEAAELLRMQQERERAAQLAAEREAAAREAELHRQDSLKQVLKAFGEVHYAYNSSYLTTENKDVLGQIATFMKENPSLQIELHAHADSRGRAEYNQWLSERRAERVFEYLVAQGIETSRLRALGHGETALLNHCADGVRCPAEEHAVNRRCDFMIRAF